MLPLFAVLAEQALTWPQVVDDAITTICVIAIFYLIARD